MPENEFEKEVQQKMEELKLTPSDKVWETVLSNLQPQKKRRKKLVLFFIFLCFLLISIIFLPVIKTNYFFEKPVADLNHAVASNNVPTTKLDPLFNNDKREKTQSEVPYPETKKVTINAGNNAPATQQTPALMPENTKSGVNPSYKKTKNGAGKKLIKITAGSIEETTDIINEPNEDLKQSSPEQNKFTPINKAKIIINRDSFIKPVIVKKIVDMVVSKLVAIEKKSTEKKKINKWILGFSAAIGKSATGNGYFASGNNRNYNYSSSPITNPGNNTNNSYQPSVIHSAVAFTVGIQATHKLTPKSNILIGLNYKLLRTSLLVGKDSALNNTIIYSIGNTKTYRNNYHFIELPITFQLQFFNVKKHPVYLDAGVSISQLVHVNSLQFNDVQGNYYSNNNLFNKTVVGFSAGLLVNILSNKSAPFLLGPQFYYSATTVAKAGLYANAHYNFIGIKLQKLLRKN